MLHKKIELNEEGSYDAYASLYLIEDNYEMKRIKRPVAVICPGGGYEFVSCREGEPYALQFLSKGYHAVVLHYSIAPSSRYPTALLELGRVVSMLRENKEKWLVDDNKIFLVGSSAGGHLAASYACFWPRSFLSEKLVCEKESLCPNGLILCYPVITSGEYANRVSFENLLGDKYDLLIDDMSLEKQVSKENPPTFIWHTAADDLVPVENSLMFAKALHNCGVEVELHVFPRGGHGLALANTFTANSMYELIHTACEGWVNLAHRWVKETIGELEIPDL